ncbi:MAG TPA: hypothetical protein VMR34_04190, partial [Candidatus Saccharimonadales bacterium]|nr:hypothetical protein [Candidatus Saccharimonadales bacterium]
MKNIYNNSPKFGKTLLNFLVLSLLAIVVVLLVNTKHAAAYSTSECGTGSGQLVSGLALGAFDTTTFSTNYDYTDSFYIPPGQSSVTVPWYVQDYNCPVNATSPTEPVFVMGVDATPESPGMTINGTTADQQIYPDFHTPPPPNDSTWGNMNPGTFTDIYSQIQVTFTPSASQLNSCQTYYIQYYPLQTGAPFYTSGDSGFSVCLYQVSGSITAGCDVFGLGDPGVDVDSASNGGIPGYPTLFYFQVGNTNFPLYEVTSLPAAYAIPLSLVNSGPTTVYLYVYQNIAGTWSSAVSTYTIPAACTAPPPPSTINVVAKCTGTNTATATVTMDDYSGAQVNGFYFDTNTAVYYNYYPYPANVTGTAPGPVYIGTVNFTTTSKTTKVRAFFEDGEGQYVPSNNPPPTPITPCLNHPYFQVKGGDISSGSLPGCIGTPEASAGVYGPDGASPTIGSQLAIYALGVISGYASDQQGVTDGNTNLDFANNGPNT